MSTWLCPAFLNPYLGQVVGELHWKSCYACFV